MRKGRTTPNGGVYIAMSHLGPETVRDRFGGMVRRCADSGFDLAGGQVEVVPTAHYFMGGLVCDPETRTDLPGLYVAGEDAGGAHGANRLGGNGVANSTVFGGIAGDTMAADAAAGNLPLRDPDDGVLAAEVARALHPFGRAGPRGPAGDVHGLRRRLMDLMWDDAGVIRTAENLTRAQAQLGGLEAELLETGLADDSRVFNLTWHDWLNLRSLVEVSQVIAAAALARENSCGAHYREDCPGEGDPAEASFTIIRRDGGGLDVSRAPVNFSIVQPGESLLGEDHATLAAV